MVNKIGIIKKIDEQVEEEWLMFKQEMSMYNQNVVFNSHEEITYKNKAKEYIRGTYLKYSGLAERDLEKMVETKILNSLYGYHVSKEGKEGITEGEIRQAIYEVYGK